MVTVVSTLLHCHRSPIGERVRGPSRTSVDISKRAVAVERQLAKAWLTNTVRSVPSLRYRYRWPGPRYQCHRIGAAWIVSDQRSELWTV